MGHLGLALRLEFWLAARPVLARVAAAVLGRVAAGTPIARRLPAG